MSNLGTKFKRTTYKLKRYLFTPIFKFNRVQFNLIGIFFIFIGTVVGGIGIVPRIFALNETQYIIAQGGNTDFSTGTPVNVSASSTNISLAKNTGWYSLNWNYKKQLTIKNTSSATLNANSAMSITIDTSSLESVLANCNDLRIIYQGTTELPLTISREPGSTNCNDSKATVLTFPIQANLTTGASDSTNYALYYGNTGASSQGTNGYSIPGGPVASMICSFKSSTTCETGQTPTTETGAIRYSGTKSAISLNGTNNISIPNISEMTTGGGTFTAEGWFYISRSSDGVFIGKNGFTNGLYLYGSNDVYCSIINTSNTAFSVSSTITLNQWTHFACQYDSTNGNITLYKNGIYIGNATFTGSIRNNGTTLSIFKDRAGTPYVNGYADEVRLSTVVRYNSNFTPSTSPFTTDSNTKILYHFDENGDDPRNTGKAIDASGNGNHGTITGGKYISGLVGVDKDSSNTGNVSTQTYASHSGVFIEEGTTNLITNPSFEHGTYNTNWSSNYMNYATASATFTPSMAKRSSAGPFAAGPVLQGKLDSSGTPDTLVVSRGTLIGSTFYSNFDPNQGSVVFWITPEWNGNDGLTHYILGLPNNQVDIFKDTDNKLYIWLQGGQSLTVDISSWTSGTTYNVVARWDSINKINGTNYASISINNVTSYGTTNATTLAMYNSNFNIGSSASSSFPANAIIEGFTIYRRVLYDGTYGTNIGNGNEISQIYNSGTGKDPTLITGSWDVVFALPTDASGGSLTTGTGNAWSHPHGSNLLYTSTTNTGGYMMGRSPSLDSWSSTNNILLDTFTDVNGTLLSNHTPDTNVAAGTWGNNADQWTIQSNTASNGDNYTTFPVINVNQSDYRTRFTINLSGNSANLRGIIVRSTSNASAYYKIGVRYPGNTFEISDEMANVLATTSVSLSQSIDYTIEVLTYGSNIFALLNGSNLISYTSAVKGSNTYIGISTRFGADKLDTLTVDKLYPLISSEKIFAGGYSYTSTGANQGMYGSFTATNGGDYVLRALGNSDGTCNPQVKITRADGTTEISHLNGTTTSTRGSPDIYIFTWESPAAEANQIQLINTASSGTCYWHQVEVLSNVVNNPSLETGSGTPWLPTNWVNGNTTPTGTITQETTIVNSGSSSIYINNITNSGTVEYPLGVPSAGIVRSAGFAGRTISNPPNTPNVGYANCKDHVFNSWSPVINITTTSWKNYFQLIRYSGIGGVVAMNTNAKYAYYDDFYAFNTTAVSLTITPANQTNSTETSGLRVDGTDTLIQPISGLSTTSGVIKFKFTPRYSSTVSNKFGSGNPYIFFSNDGTTNNYLLMYTTSTRVYFRQVAGGVQVDKYTSSYSFTAGTTYDIELSYVSGGNLDLKVNGVSWISQSGGMTFTQGLTTAAYGVDNNFSPDRYDGTYSNFSTSTITKNTTAPYMKFGSNSVKIVNGGTLGDEYSTSLNVGNTSSYTLSAYVYDGTTGNLGGTVSNSIAELYFNNATISTTYTDMGGGWWRLNGSLTGVNQSALYGVQVKAGKTIYLDGVQLEAKTYPSSYADGSLGTGYSWNGTANNSISTRTLASLGYPSTNNIQTSSGSISFWAKANSTSENSRIFSLLSIFNGIRYFDLYYNGSGLLELYLDVDFPSKISKNVTWSMNNWKHVVITWNQSLNTSKLYINNDGNPGSGVVGTIDFGNAQLLFQRSAGGATRPNVTYSDFRIYNQDLSSSQVSDLYYQGLGLHSQSVTDDKKYQSTGTWESPVINLGQAGQWGASTNFDTVETLNGNTVGYETKTSNDGNTWSAYSSVTGSGGGYDIQSSPNKYIQIKTTLNSASQNTTPVVSSQIINYVQDAEAPITNGVNTLMKVNSLGRTVPETGWTNDLSPYFQWDLAEDNLGGSGIKGYCLNLSQTPGENPATTKGLLGTSPVSTANSTCQFIVGINNISFDGIALRGNTWLSASTDPYYLSIKAIDNTGNIFPTSEVFEFKFDDIPPTNVTSFSTPQNSFANVDDIYFNWPANGNGIASDSTSGLLGYQFAINNETTWLGSSADSTLGIDYIPLNFSQPFYLDALRDGSYFQIGNNTIYLRAIDSAGNKASISRTALVSYGGNAPTFDNGSVLTINPTTNTSNMYSVSWPAATPANGRTVTKYYYMINTTPPATLSTMLNNSSIYIETTNLNIPNGSLTGAIKGSNTIYVVAVDDLNNYSPSNALSTSFTLDSSLPDPVKNLSVSDASVKSASLWRVSLAWEEPDYKGTGVLTYKIQRSTDNSTWTNVSTTSGNAYVDTVSESKRYYWRVGSMDTTNTSIASPSYALSVTFIPKGSYTSEAPLVSGPTTSNITTRKATVSWITSRTADSRVVYGLKSGEYFEAETTISNQVTNHAITLTNLLPATTYFYKARWTDEDGNLGESNEQSFTTSDAPSIKDVQVKSVGINFAQVKFTTKGATKAKIYYGKTTLFGGVIEVSTSTNESTYTVILEGLEDGTKYYYRINPYDIEDTEFEGTVLDLKTYPKPKVFSVNMQQIRNTAETSIQVSWQSNTEVSSIVTYYPEGKIEQSRDQVNLSLTSGEHKLVINGLLPDTKYVLVVKGLDRIGNEAKSDSQTFTTATDTRSPKISEVLVETYPGEVDNGSGKKNSQIIVSWKTDEPATSRVEYGEGNTDVYEFKTPEDDNLKLNHVVIINNLDISKIYHLRAVSLDKAKNESKSQDVVTVTAKTQDNAFDLIFKNIRNIFNF